MSTRAAVTALVSVAALLVVGASASAQTQARDSVSGTVHVALPPAPPEFGTLQTFDVSSGPSGENPTGVITFVLLPFGIATDYPITCLAVNGNAATVGLADLVFPDLAGYTQVVDGGPGGVDQLGTVGSGPATDCPKPPISFVSTFNIVSGDLVVVDAQPSPTSKDQCENGGWRNFPGFKNQGNCVSFVATGGRNPPSG
jgi:hypothetical protein